MVGAERRLPDTGPQLHTQSKPEGEQREMGARYP